MSNLSESMTHLVYNVQEADNKARELCIKIAEKGVYIIDDSPWSMSNDGLLRYNECVYIPKSSAVIQEIIKVNYSDLQGRHLQERCTLESICCCYYWCGIGCDIQIYIR